MVAGVVEGGSATDSTIKVPSADVFNITSPLVVLFAMPAAASSVGPRKTHESGLFLLFFWWPFHVLNLVFLGFLPPPPHTASRCLCRSTKAGLLATAIPGHTLESRSKSWCAAKPSTTASDSSNVTIFKKKDRVTLGLGQATPAQRET